MSVLLIHSHFGPVPAAYAAAVAEGRVTSVRERDLTEADFAATRGLITTQHLDQIGFLAHSAALQSLLDRGGRWFFNGHILRRFVDGLDIYQPIARPKRADFVLTRLSEHAIFAGIDPASLEENNGVAGFYGRGHNPLPPGAQPVNGIGPDRLPIDWDWVLPSGGRIFSHAGNDLGGMAGQGGSRGTSGVPVERILAWCAGEIGQ
jgi:hypothetical protein